MPDTKDIEVDWTPLLKYPPNEVECKCGTVYYSHTKGVTVNGVYIHLCLKACPKCGHSVDSVRRVSTSPERITVSADVTENMSRKFGVNEEPQGPPPPPLSKPATFTAAEEDAMKAARASPMYNVKRDAEGNALRATIRLPLSRVGIMFLSRHGEPVHPGEGAQIDGYRFVLLDREGKLDVRAVQKATLVLDYSKDAEALWEIESLVWDDAGIPVGPPGVPVTSPPKEPEEVDDSPWMLPNPKAGLNRSHTVRHQENDACSMFYHCQREQVNDGKLQAQEAAPQVRPVVAEPVREQPSAGGDAGEARSAGRPAGW
jgi:hypothetical protein